MEGAAAWAAAAASAAVAVVMEAAAATAPTCKHAAHGVSTWAGGSVGWREAVDGWWAHPVRGARGGDADLAGKGLRRSRRNRLRVLHGARS